MEYSDNSKPDKTPTEVETRIDAMKKKHRSRRVFGRNLDVKINPETKKPVTFADIIRGKIVEWGETAYFKDEEKNADKMLAKEAQEDLDDQTLEEFYMDVAYRFKVTGQRFMHFMSPYLPQFMQKHEDMSEELEVETSHSVLEQEADDATGELDMVADTTRQDMDENLMVDERSSERTVDHKLELEQVVPQETHNVADTLDDLSDEVPAYVDELDYRESAHFETIDEEVHEVESAAAARESSGPINEEAVVVDETPRFAKLRALTVASLMQNFRQRKRVNQLEELSKKRYKEVAARLENSQQQVRDVSSEYQRKQKIQERLDREQRLIASEQLRSATPQKSVAASMHQPRKEQHYEAPRNLHSTTVNESKSDTEVVRVIERSGSSTIVRQEAIIREREVRPGHQLYNSKSKEVASEPEVVRQTSRELHADDIDNPDLVKHKAGKVFHSPESRRQDHNSEFLPQRTSRLKAESRNQARIEKYEDKELVLGNTSEEALDRPTPKGRIRARTQSIRDRINSPKESDELSERRPKVRSAISSAPTSIREKLQQPTPDNIVQPWKTALLLIVMLVFVAWLNIAT